MESTKRLKQHYMIVLKDDRTFTFKDYEYMKSWWATHAKSGLLEFVEIIDYCEEINSKESINLRD